MPRIETHPLTPARWPDLEALFGPNGAYGGCWCMFFRLRRKDAHANGNAGNRVALKAIVDSGHPPGLLAYVDGQVAGWVSLDSRDKFEALAYSRKLQPVDDTPVWSIVCFVVGRKFRKQRLMTRLLDAAVDYAREHGATTVEAYPVEPIAELKSYDGYTGVASTFKRAGFKEVKRASNRQLIVRREVR